MRILTYCWLLLLPTLTLAQAKTFEIFGTVKGESKEKIYLFFDGNMAQADSLSAPVKNGKFYFRLKAELPIICRLHQGGSSELQDIFIDSDKTFLMLSSQLLYKENPDSLGGAFASFQVTGVKGSRTEDMRRSLNAWKEQLYKRPISEEQKRSEYFARLQALVASHPKSKASAYLVADRIFLMGKAFMMNGKFHFTYSEVKQLAGLLDPSLYHTFEWENLSRLLERLDQDRHRGIGTPFHDVVLKDSSGKEVDTKSIRNKYVLVDFWASWCKPCRALNPQLKSLYARYKDKGLEIISISLDEDKSAWKKAIQRDGLTWPQLIDEKAFGGELVKHYDLNGVPVKILIDKEGGIAGYDLPIEEIESILATSL